MPQPGWYPDPYPTDVGSAPRVRWWAGDRWTEATLFAEPTSAAPPVYGPMSYREFMFSRPADWPTTKASVRMYGRWWWAIVAVGALTGVILFFTGADVATIAQTVTTLGIAVWLISLAVFPLWFRRGGRPPAGLYRLGFGPRRRWDGAGWLDPPR